MFRNKRSLRGFVLSLCLGIITWNCGKSVHQPGWIRAENINSLNFGCNNSKIEAKDSKGFLLGSGSLAEINAAIDRSEAVEADKLAAKQKARAAAESCR